MVKETFKFKGWIAALNLTATMLFVWFTYLMFPIVKDDLSNITGVDSFYTLLFFLVCIWAILTQFGYSFLLYLPNGLAVELQEEYILVCSPFGIKKIPKSAVRGCNNPVHRTKGGPKSGLVIISVSPEFRVIGPYGYRVNPQFHGASVKGEDEQTMVNKIRAWRRVKTANK